MTRVLTAGRSRNAPFDDARRSFLDTLSPAERGTVGACSTPEALLVAIQNLKIQSLKGQKRTLNRCLNVIKKCNDRLRPYFDALNVIASANDTAAFTYGAFRIILEVSTALHITSMLMLRPCIAC